MFVLDRFIGNKISSLINKVLVVYLSKVELYVEILCQERENMVDRGDRWIYCLLYVLQFGKLILVI